ncbi:hypothetical protein COJ45_13550 [Bacillus cereus]|uniref:DUF1064 domain-containing protein n=1 Tax=Bacillus cereus TaxID=1396 RepID=UPI000BF5449D|nr:DUF1064 domain-containing protein [Bacillus cereus]PFM47381.1 hypothetical protein COJ45_13550 [Bacillus cereus]
MSKYNNKKVELDGCIYDSEAEFKYYELLKEKQGAGEIQEIELQPSFVIFGFRAEENKIAAMQKIMMEIKFNTI